MSLKESQGHQTITDNADPQQGYNQAKFERSSFNGVLPQKAMFFFFFFKQGNMLFISLETCAKNLKKSGSHDLLDVINNHTKFQLNCIRT